METLIRFKVYSLVKGYWSLWVHLFACFLAMAADTPRPGDVPLLTLRTLQRTNTRSLSLSLVFEETDDRPEAKAVHRRVSPPQRHPACA